MRQAKRLSAGEEREAITDFAIYQLGDDCPDLDYHAYVHGCRVLYRDDYDVGKFYYQVVDPQGHGDGSNAWTEIK
jgi:hypothetical protein